MSSWNEKNLDYEIETVLLEIRIRPSRGTTWNEKNLDYEIETRPVHWRRNLPPVLLEMKRTSITRLKLLTERMHKIC